MKLVLRTVVVLVVAYGCYAVLVLLPAWLPSLPVPPRLPLLDPQEVLSGLGVLPREVAGRIDEARRTADDLRKEAEELPRKVEKEARRAVEEGGKKLDEERRKREDEARRALGL